MRWFNIKWNSTNLVESSILGEAVLKNPVLIWHRVINAANVVKL